MASWVGPALSVASSVLGGLGGKSKRGPSIDDQLAANLQAEQNSFRWRMSAAKEYGISKLAMLGVPAFNAPSFQFGSHDSDMGGAGQFLGRAAGALGTFADRMAQEKITDLQVEGAQLDNEYKRSLIRNMNQAGQPPAVPFGGSPIAGQGDSRYPVQAQMPMGYGDTAPFWVEGKDAHGQPIRMYNTNGLGDNETIQVVTAPATIHDMVRNLGQRVGKWLTEPRYERKWYHGNRY